MWLNITLVWLNNTLVWLNKTLVWLNNTLNSLSCFLELKLGKVTLCVNNAGVAKHWFGDLFFMDTLFLITGILYHMLKETI